MGQPAAAQGDQVVGTDTHIVVPPQGPPTPVPLPFSGLLSGGLSRDVTIGGRAAAVVGSTADNVPPHVPAGGSFQRPPSNRGTVQRGSATVTINGAAAARAGDAVVTCNDPVDAAVAVVVAGGTVLIG